MKKILLFLLFLCACQYEPSYLVQDGKVLKVTSVETKSDSTSLYVISAYGTNSIAEFKIEKKNGFATVGDVIDIVNLSRTMPTSTPTKEIKDTATIATNKNLKN